METILKVNLFIHILAGMTGFFVAPVAMIVKKGGKAHRQWGWVYMWAMAVSAGTALFVSSVKNNWFFISLAVFSFYAAFSGYRVLKRKKLYITKSVPAVDWVAVLLNILFCGVLIYLGIISLPGAFGFIAMAFGLIGLNNGVRDVRHFLNPKDEKNKWLFDHMGGMMGSYIAAVSAFSVNNLNFEWMPTVINWLWPTMIGVPLMMRWMSLYKKKFNAGKKATELVEVKL